MVGRRRVGKSTLLKQAFEGKNVVYLFVSRKAEPLLAEEFTEQIKAQLDLPHLWPARFAQSYPGDPTYLRQIQPEHRDHGWISRHSKG